MSNPIIDAIVAAGFKQVAIAPYVFQFESNEYGLYTSTIIRQGHTKPTGHVVGIASYEDRRKIWWALGDRFNECKAFKAEHNLDMSSFTVNNDFQLKDCYSGLPTGEPYEPLLQAYIEATRK